MMYSSKFFSVRFLLADAQITLYEHSFTGDQQTFTDSGNRYIAFMGGWVGVTNRNYICVLITRYFAMCVMSRIINQ